MDSFTFQGVKRFDLRGPSQEEIVRYHPKCFEQWSTIRDGTMSDKQLVEKSGFLRKFDPVDTCLADRIQYSGTLSTITGFPHHICPDGTIKNV